MCHLKHNVLLVVEGEKGEKTLVDSLFRAFNLDAMYHVHPYHTVVHDLINRIVTKYEGDYDNIEICKVLAEMLDEQEDSEERDLLLYTKFTDVILMFDFDPQDDRMDACELRKMLVSFNDSSDTDRGLLLLNYPAVESIKEAAALQYEEFLASYAYVDDERSYKEVVNRLLEGKRGKFGNYEDYTSMLFAKVIGHSVGKVQHLLGDGPIENTFPMSSSNSLSQACQELRLVSLLDYQLGELEANQRVATCGTGPFFMAAWQRALDGTWKSCFGD